MPIPDYQTFMRPLLALLEDGEPRRMRDLYSRLATDFQLTSTELAEMLPSGRQPTYMNRIGWAKTYLLKAGALQSAQRGSVQITPRGRALLADHAEPLNTKRLFAFPEFIQFQGGNPLAPEHATPTPSLSPDEQLATLAAELNSTLRTELLTQVTQLTPSQFERLVVELLVAMGYGGNARDAGQALGRSGDNGVDGLIKQDPLGLGRIYLQAKRWQNVVHSPEIRGFSGSLTFHKASKGVFLTTSSFSEGARQTAQQIGNIILIDGQTLADYMIEYGVGVLTRETYHLRRLDSEYFEEL
ncbi:restriction endonuclease [Deinococcus arcticus]|uniref:Restriction endonuclease n=1 Tax=Deinococcus arcticus TaxID=2136176 RepID=A0A2T3WCR6_9DEIO|nr:restriction endonuclease [Deinococcus arcticus]PTA69705.1 restriction endonuclease [Deinococcus arcticus]